VSNEQADLLRRQVAAEVLQQGDAPSGLRRWAEQMTTARVDWRAELAAELRQGVAEVAGAVDYTYSRPSRRAAISGDVVLPALRKPTPEIAVVCDTSGSVSEHLLGEALTEIDSVLSTVGNRGMRVLACDAAVHASRRVTSVDQVELLGGGGTDMAIGIEAALDHRPRPQVVVVLTDGMTPWPDRPPPGTRVVVGLLGDHPTQPPEWAHTVAISETEG
jgi:predicted metal-dependent peptidase